jgi:Bacteriophage head to tail connecting protein
MPSSEELIQYHKSRAETLRSDRSTFDTHCEEVAELVMPAHRNTFTSQGQTLPYEKKTDRQYDSTATIACQRFAAVFESLLTPQSKVWHRLVPADPMLKRNRQVRLWFDDVNALLVRYRAKPIANFVGQMQQAYLALGLYGNGSLFLDAPETEPGLRYKYMHLGETYFAESHSGVIDTFYRFFKFTARQAIQAYGDAVPENIRVAAEKKPEQQFEFIQCVYPRGESEYDPRRRDSQGLPFASLHICATPPTIVRESGYKTFPLAVSRYLQNPGEVYARSPAMLVLPNIKVLNQEKKDVLKQGQRILDPVLLAADDGVIGAVSLRAGAVNYGAVNADGKALLQTLPTGSLVAGDKLMELEKQVVHDAFLITLFQILVDNPRMTATEVLERSREKGMLIAPTAGRQNAEFLGPMIGRELDLLVQQNLLPPVPPLLAQAGGGYAVEYDSPLSQMQRAENAAGFMRSLDTTLEIVRVTADPSPLDYFNMDVAVPAIMDINGAPTSWTRTLEEVQQLRADRTKQEQQKMMLENAAGLGAGMKSMADVGQKNAA